MNEEQRSRSPVDKTLRSSRWLFVAIGGILVLALTAGCFPMTGSYPVDIFGEMHYQQTHHSQEPPRLAANEESVPITGREVIPKGAALKALQSPLDTTDVSMARAAEVFRVNCAMCHGMEGGREGPGAVGQTLADHGYAIPPNLTVEPTTTRSDGDIFGIISNGLFVMPPFRNILTEEERWLVVHQVRKLQER